MLLNPSYDSSASPSERSSNNADNEFGPGFYTADSLDYALEYVRLGGAIMVFQDPDLHSNAVWEPSLELSLIHI